MEQAPLLTSSFRIAPPEKPPSHPYNVHRYNGYLYIIFKCYGERYNNCCDMRTYILTDREREIVERVIKGERPDTFRQIKSIAIRVLPRIEEDLELIKRFLKMVE